MKPPRAGQVSTSGGQVQEVLQQVQPDGLALLRVELRREGFARPDGRGKRFAIDRPARHDRVIARPRIKAMDEILNPYLQ